jgi:hypothetical protein
MFHTHVYAAMSEKDRRERERKLCEKINLKTGNVVSHILPSNFDHNVNFLNKFIEMTHRNLNIPPND